MRSLKKTLRTISVKIIPFLVTWIVGLILCINFIKLCCFWTRTPFSQNSPLYSLKHIYLKLESGFLMLFKNFIHWLIAHSSSVTLNVRTFKDFPGGTSSKEPACQCRGCKRQGFGQRKWQPTSVFLPGRFHGQRSLVGYSPWGRKESDMTEVI